MAEWITIAGDRLTAAINPFGAELSSLTDAGGRELMTDADPAFWTGRAPLLFPVVGQPAGDTIRVDGRAYPMTKHGFARRLEFEVVAALSDFAIFALTDTPASRAIYPFAFRLEMAFRARGATLEIDASIENRSRSPMPASFGFHPAFAWPLPYGAPRADHRLVFDREERASLWRLDPDGTLAPEPRPSPLDGRTLHLRDELFADDALIWDRLHSQRVRYGASDGPQLDIAFPDTPQLGVWTKPGARFVCIEPWHGLADPRGFAGEFRSKPGVFVIPPDGMKRIGMSVTLVG